MSHTMKPIAILKRPADATPGVPMTEGGMSARVAAQVSASLEGALLRERTRLENSFRARQELLLTSVSSVLTENLERIVNAAVAKEALGLAAAIEAARAAAPAPEPDLTAEQIRACFAAAFEREALADFEGAVRDMLARLAVLVEKQVDIAVVQPVAGAAGALTECAQAVSAAKFSAQGAVRAAEAKMASARERAERASGAPREGVLESERRVVGPEEAAAALVQKALDEGRISDALQACAGQSAKVIAKGLSGGLESEIEATEIFREVKLKLVQIAELTAILASDLNDRTEKRLSWMYELLSLMEVSSEDGEEIVAPMVERTKRFLERAVEHLKDFHVKGALSSADAKHVKLLVHVLKAHISSME